MGRDWARIGFQPNNNDATRVETWEKHLVTRQRTLMSDRRVTQDERGVGPRRVVAEACRQRRIGYMEGDDRK